MLTTTPAVFAVDHHYQIMVPTSVPCLFWIEIDNERFENATNGILRSQVPVHSVSVPMAVLDRAKQYTVCVRPIDERKPYFTKTQSVWREHFSFRPVCGEAIRAYHISDAHERFYEPIAAAKAFGEIDLLILNGDLLNHAGNGSRFIQIYQLIEELTHGEIPVVYARGNHDTRGIDAELMEQYTPKCNGNTYYSFRLGSLWGLVLDCAEDKPDDHEEYGYTVCCHKFREIETVFLQDIIRRAESEYKADGITTRIVICHNPFVNAYKPPFNIEQDLYTAWSEIIRSHIHPHLLLCGHVHKTYVQTQNDERNAIPLPCPLVVGSMPSEQGFSGCGIEIHSNCIDIVFTDHTGNIQPTQTIKKYS